MTKSASQLYLELLKKSLSFALWPEPPVPLVRYNYARSPLKRGLVAFATSMLSPFKVELVKRISISESDKENGRFWPGYAHTMVGLKRLENLQWCIETALAEHVKGDLIETGVWRGGASIFMRGVLAAHGVEERRVFVADSFAGLPRPNAERYPADQGDTFHTHPLLSVSKDEVMRNFAKYGLLDEQVVFLEGWFRDTLPKAPIERLAVMRLDGDMYESTMDGLENLYPKLENGGFCIVDDYVLEPCRQAVHDYRAHHHIVDPIRDVDGTGSFWRKGEIDAQKHRGASTNGSGPRPRSN